MPVFVYRCQNEECGHEFELFIHNRDEGEVMLCPVCRNEKLANRVMQPGKIRIDTGHTISPYMEYDLGPEPVYIQSKDHLEAECRKRGFGMRKMPGKLK